MSKADPTVLVTHSERFHADDVFASALLLDLFPNARVVRSRDEAVIASGDIVYDVGKVFDPSIGRFDHHQPGADRRENGIIYSSFGLLWREYGLQFCGGDVELQDAIDKSFVAPIDAVDNGQNIINTVYDGVTPFSVDMLIGVMNPQLWVDAAEAHDEQFNKAVELAKQILYRVRDAAKNDLLSHRYLLELYKHTDDRRVLIADRTVDDVSGIVNECPELLYAVAPRPAGTWGVQAVATEPGSFASRRPFPDAWRARPVDELKELTGVADVVFVHAAGFLAVADSKEGAVALAYAALQEGSGA